MIKDSGSGFRSNALRRSEPDIVEEQQNKVARDANSLLHRLSEDFGPNSFVIDEVVDAWGVDSDAVEPVPGSGGARAIGKQDVKQAFEFLEEKGLIRRSEDRSGFEITPEGHDKLRE